MEGQFDKGFAFVCEGDTEKVFYLQLLLFLCEKYQANLEKVMDENDPDIKYLLSFGEKKYLIKLQIAGTVTQVPYSGKWFTSQCLAKHKNEVSGWIVFLCYDSDSYTADVSKFQKDDWKVLRKKLSGAEKVLDICASAEIEDALLVDLAGICSYYGIEMPTTPLPGNSGKAKLKRLLRNNNIYYHTGNRAKDLIKSLDMQRIIDKSTLPLYRIEEYMFK